MVNKCNITKVETNNNNNELYIWVILESKRKDGLWTKEITWAKIKRV